MSVFVANLQRLLRAVITLLCAAFLSGVTIVALTFGLEIGVQHMKSLYPLQEWKPLAVDHPSSQHCRKFGFNGGAVINGGIIDCVMTFYNYITDCPTRYTVSLRAAATDITIRRLKYEKALTPEQVKRMETIPCPQPPPTELRGRADGITPPGDE